MGHNHASAGGQHRGRLKIVFGLTSLYMIAGFIGAFLTNSLALLARLRVHPDAGLDIHHTHNPA